jgi:hypothetical protein
MTDEEKAQVASLIARLDKRCACMCDEDGEIVSQCLAHVDLQAEAAKTEREACAKLAAEFDAINDDGYPVRPEGTVAGAELIAQAIRARTD